MKAYTRYVECLLILYNTNSKEDRITKRDIKKVSVCTDQAHKGMKFGICICSEKAIYLSSINILG